MSIDPRIERLRRAACARRRLILLGVASPPLLAVVVPVARAVGPSTAIAFALFAATVLAWGLLWVARGVDARWLARALDARAVAMEDSAALLFRDATALAPLEALQRTRLLQRLDRLGLDLRPAWPWRLFGASAALAAGVLVAGAFVSPIGHRAAKRADTDAPTAETRATRLVDGELAIAPPAYTRLPERSEAALDAKVPQDSRLRWRLRFAPRPTAVALAFHDGHRVELRRDGDAWRGDATLAASALYRIVLDGAAPLADDRLHRIDVIADTAPDIRVIVPERTLTLAQAQQKSWPLAFEASDDYGIARAELVVTHAQGSGENIAFEEQTIALDAQSVDGLAVPAAGAVAPPNAPHTAPPPAAERTRDGRGPRAVLRYSHTLDLAALGFSKGDDVVVRLVVVDDREPTANRTRSPSLILRWPTEPSKENAGLEGIVQKTMPAYFRSQRQIIIDTEALLGDRPQLDDAKFLARSDAIGVDQKLLRLRYGQFLGEESEGHAGHAPEGAAIGAADTQAGALAAAHETQERAAPDAPTTFGDAGDVVAEYGHVHDIAEAATLLDPDTRAILKSALGEMWQAELHLRQGAPALALPYERRALDYVKQVQQATRIYLARVGLELPVPDEARRLSGDRKDLVDRSASLAPAPAGDAALAALWHTLDGHAAPDWDAAQRALAARGDTPDALGALAALDRARRDERCDACRRDLRAALWSLLPPSPAATTTRPAPDAADRDYLDALVAPEAAR